MHYTGSNKRKLITSIHGCVPVFIIYFYSRKSIFKNIANAGRIKQTVKQDF